MSYCQKLRVAFCSEEHTNNVIFINPQTGEHVHTLAGHTSLVTQCVHIAEYMLFATSSMDMTIALWEQDSGQCVYFTTTTTLNEDPMPQTYLMWDSQHKLLFTGAMDGRIIGWQLKITGKIEITRKYVLFEKRKYSLQINEQTKHLLGMNRDGGIYN
ncbi:MAG: hypothetical protein EZS28_048036 [Streblomastix strix]|uniref:Uncharacterized protein n=1 Tax=Streblomastix strix TaxID=222440 RepID=A0A5J4TE43_9EUKA|nr:MAG: hypothetical protein EZS28_048036 [Streblomastix strix]